MDAPSIPPIDTPRHRPTIPPTGGKAVNVPDPAIFPDIPTSSPHRLAPDSVDSTDSTESLPSSTTTETSTSDAKSASPEPSLPPTTIVTIVTASPLPTPTTATFISSDPVPSDSDTVRLSTRIVSGNSPSIPPTPTSFGFSTSTTLNDDLIPSSSRLTYPTDNGNHGSNPNNTPPSDGSVSGGNSSNATEKRRFSTGAIIGIVISLTLFCFVGFVFWRRRQRRALRTEHANRWWFSRTRPRPEGYMHNAAARPPTVYSSSFGSSFERTRSNSSLSNDEFGSSRPPMVEVVLNGSHSLNTTNSQYFVRPDSAESSYNDSIPPPPTSARLASSPPSETSTALPQHPPSAKYNSSYSITSIGRSLTLIPGPGSPTSRVFIPPIPPLPKSPPPIPITMSNPFLDHNPFDDPVHH